MRTIVAAAALAGLLGQAALGQESGAEDGAAATSEGDVGGATGLATGAASATFFIPEPLEYHLLATALPGQPVFLDATDTGLQRRGGTEAVGAGEIDAAFLEGDRPIGAITDLLIDRRGGAAGLVVELDPEMRGGGREVAVAMGLVRMLADPEDPALTHILLSIDPVDLENAPSFARSDLPEGAEEEAAEPAAEQPEGEEPGAAEQPAGEQPAGAQPGAAEQPEAEAAPEAPAEAPEEEGAADAPEDGPLQE